MRRVFDICHGCRRCFNLCDSFPRLFDLIDTSPNEELSDVKSEDFKPVVEACTLCDMCFMTKCPYVPPHPFQLDFPASDAAPPFRRGENRAISRIHPAAIGRDGPQRHAGAGCLARHQLGLGHNPTNRCAPLMENVAGIDRNADLPKFHSPHFRLRRPEPIRITPNPAAPAYRQDARPRSMPPALSITTSRSPAWRRARCSIISAWKPKPPIPAAAACRSWNRRNCSAWRTTPPKCRRNWSS